MSQTPTTPIVAEPADSMGPAVTAPPPSAAESVPEPAPALAADAQSDPVDAACQWIAEQTPFTAKRCNSVIDGTLAQGVSWVVVTALVFVLVMLGIRRVAGGRSAGETTALPRPGLRTWLADRLLARRRERRYLRALADTPTLKRQPVFGAEPRARRGYEVPLKVADDHLTGQPETPPPLTASGMPLVGGRSVTLPEALTAQQQPDGRRLLILGEPGAGKSTLLAGLALSMAARDPDYGPFARALVPNRLANALEGLRRRLDGLSVLVPGALAGLAALLLWVIGIFVSGAPVTQLLLALLWLVAGFLLLWPRPAAPARVGWLPGRFRSDSGSPCSCSATPGSAGPRSGPRRPGRRRPLWCCCSIGSGRCCPWGCLKWLVRRNTRYPLPVLLTLNELADGAAPLEACAAAMIAEKADLDPDGARRLLERRLKAGGCLLLLDALDEVSDEARRTGVRKELKRLLDGWHGRNQTGADLQAGGGCGAPGVLEEAGGAALRAAADRAVPRQLFRRDGCGQGAVQALQAELARNPRLLTLAGNPLLLSRIALLFKAEGRLPRTRAGLFERAIELMVSGWDGETDAACRDRPRAPLPCAPDAFLCVLRELAAAAHARRRRVLARAELDALLTTAAQTCGVALDAETLRTAMLERELLRRLSATGYDFAHLSFQEYLTAAWYHAQGGTAGLLARLSEDGDPAWWREVVRLYAGLGGEAAALVRHFLPTDPLLAAGCLADAAAADGTGLDADAAVVVARLTELLASEPMAQLTAADALAEIRAFGALAPLEQALREPGQAPERAVAAVLALAPGKEATLAERVPGGLGGLLRLLHAALPDADAARRERILALLDTLGHPLCHVPAGPFRMGSDLGGQADERPAHEVRLAEYWMDRDPVTNAQFQVFADATGFEGRAWRDLPDFAQKPDHPVVNVSWDDANAYAAWCGKRLPTEAEWEKAARGTDARRYPWGDDWDADRCNVESRGTTPVGGFDNGASPYGCRGMAGNVYDWCADWYDKDWYRAEDRSNDNPTGPAQGVSRVVRGGSWDCNPALARAAHRSHLPPHSQVDILGFRLVCARPIR
jgi:formylglycine-generating enzyme